MVEQNVISSDSPSVDTGREQDRPSQTADSPARKFLRILLIAAIALAVILVITLPSYPQGKDYISYWSAGHLLIHHSDPYSPSGVFALQKAHGSRETGPIIMRNPPWALFLALPLGFCSPLLGYLMWTLIAVGCVLASIRLLNVPAKDSAFAWVFAPFIACLLCGQSSQFLLLGFSLFLRFYRTRPFLAGASLLLMAIKPHLFLVFWAVLLVDCLYQRRALILLGCASALAAASAFPLLFEHHIWRDYLAMVHSASLGIEVFPTASMQLRLLIAPNAVWLLFIPSALATLWGLWYYLRLRDSWDWNVHGMLLMLVTVLCSPYGGISDETVLLPAVFSGLRSRAQRKYANLIIMAANTLALGIVLSHASLTSRAYLWTPFAWLGWYLYSTGRSSMPVHSPGSLASAGQPESP